MRDMAPPVDIHEVLAGADHVLVEAGVGAVQLLPIDRRSTLELLVHRVDVRAVHRALDGLAWRWRYGGDDLWRWGPRRVYRFDGGSSIVVHRGLRCAPWPPGSLRRLRRAVLRGDDRVPGVRPATPPAALTVAAVDAARDRFRSAGRLAALAALDAATPDREGVASFARSAGVERIVVAALAAAHGAPARPPSPHAPVLGRLARAVARRMPGRWRAFADGQPVGHAVVRCRVAGMTVLAGPGVFLPRSLGDSLSAAATALLPVDRATVVVEAGASCGGQLLPVLAARRQARGVGTEIDPEAVRWASRNATRAGLPATFIAGSLLDPLPGELRGRVDLLFANLPSIRPTDFEPNADAPDAAYVGAGEDGLGLHRALVADGRRWLAPGGALLLQMAGWQWERFATDLIDLGYVPDPGVERTWGSPRDRDGDVAGRMNGGSLPPDAAVWHHPSIV